MGLAGLLALCFMLCFLLYAFISSYNPIILILAAFVAWAIFNALRLFVSKPRREN